jgi:hypothetical protein
VRRVMFASKDDQTAYIIANFSEITDQRIDDNHWDLPCTRCEVTRGFQVVRRDTQGSTGGMYGDYMRDFSAPITFYFRCPVCGLFKQWIVFELRLRPAEDRPFETHYYRVTSIPSEGLEEIEALPENPPALPHGLSPSRSRNGCKCTSGRSGNVSSRCSGHHP